jgi:hypothetical protein
MWEEEENTVIITVTIAIMVMMKDDDGASIAAFEESLDVIQRKYYLDCRRLIVPDCQFITTSPILPLY